MIINSVGETDKTRKESEEFLSIIQADDRGYLCEGLWILPGTYFYSLLKREGFIDDSFWLADKPEFGMGADEMKLRKLNFKNGNSNWIVC